MLASRFILSVAWIPLLGCLIFNQSQEVVFHIDGEQEKVLTESLISLKSPIKSKEIQENLESSVSQKGSFKKTVKLRVSEPNEFDQYITSKEGSSLFKKADLEKDFMLEAADVEASRETASQ